MKWVRVRLWLRRVLLAAVVVPACYLLAALIGLWPANSDFQDAESGVEVFVVSNGVHTDLILPTKSTVVDWEAYFPSQDFAAGRTLPHLQVGWGGRQFYLETPTWDDVRWTTLLRSAFLPNAATLHVSYVPRPETSDDCRRLLLSPEQYTRLVASLQEALILTDAGRPQRIAVAGYHRFDAFYEAAGSYHLLQTCNAWTGQRLRTAGVRVGIWTPFPGSIMSTLPPTD